MDKVEPIKNREDVNRILTVLKLHNERNYLLAVYGFNSGLRISDILNLKVKDIRGKSYFSVTEKKRGHKRDIPITPSIKRLTNPYIANKSDDEYLFKSREGFNKPIGRVQAYNIIKKAAKEAGIKQNIGTHSLRKTFAYHLLKDTGNIVYVQEILGHSSIDVTKRYLGIDLDELESSIKRLNFI